MAVTSSGSGGVTHALAELVKPQRLDELSQQLMARRGSQTKHHIFYDLSLDGASFEPNPGHTIWVATISDHDIRVVVPAMSKALKTLFTKHAKDLYRLHESQEGALVRRLPGSIDEAMKAGWLTPARLSPQAAWDKFEKATTDEDWIELKPYAFEISQQVERLTIEQLICAIELGKADRFRRYGVNTVIALLFEGYELYIEGHSLITDCLGLVHDAYLHGVITKEALRTCLLNRSPYSPCDYPSLYEELCRSTQQQFDYFKEPECVELAAMEKLALIAGLELHRFPMPLNRRSLTYDPIVDNPKPNAKRKRSRRKS